MTAMASPMPDSNSPANTPASNPVRRPRRVALIREAECIGCTKCISACPEDAIKGALKQIHIVLNEHCTGCNLCLDPCPVDCIDMLSLALPPLKKTVAAPTVAKHWLAEKRVESPPRPLISRAAARQEIAAAVARMQERRG